MSKAGKGEGGPNGPNLRKDKSPPPPRRVVLPSIIAEEQDRYDTEELPPIIEAPQADPEVALEKELGLRPLVFGMLTIAVSAITFWLWFGYYQDRANWRTALLALAGTAVAIWAAFFSVRQPLAKAEAQVEWFLHEPIKPSRRLKYALARKIHGRGYAETTLAELHEHPIVLVKWVLAAITWTLLALFIGEHRVFTSRSVLAVWAVGIGVFLVWWLLDWWLTERRKVSWIVVAIIWTAAMAVLLRHPHVKAPIVFYVWTGGMLPIISRFLMWRRNKFGFTDKRLYLMLVNICKMSDDDRNILLAKMTDESLRVSWLSKFLAWARFIKVPYGRLVVETASARRVYHLPYAREVSRMIISRVYHEEYFSDD